MKDFYFTVNGYCQMYTGNSYEEVISFINRTNPSADVIFVRECSFETRTGIKNNSKTTEE